VEVIGNEFQSVRSTRDGKRLIISGCRCLLREQQFDDTTRAKTQPLTHYTRSLETQWDVSYTSIVFWVEIWDDSCTSCGAEECGPRAELGNVTTGVDFNNTCVSMNLEIRQQQSCIQFKLRCLSVKRFKPWIRHLGQINVTGTRSTQPCIPPRSLNRVPATAAGKGGNVTSAGWQVWSYMAREFPWRWG